MIENKTVVFRLHSKLTPSTKIPFPQNQEFYDEVEFEEDTTGHKEETSGTSEGAASSAATKLQPSTVAAIGAPLQPRPLRRIVVK